MTAGSPLLAALARGGTHEVLRVDGRGLSAGELLSAAAAVRQDLRGAERVAVWMTPTLEALVAMVAGLLAGCEVVPLNPAAGELELNHVLTDSAPGVVAHARGEAVPGAGDTRRVVVDASRRTTPTAAVDGDAGRTALVLYTSGTTGPPKGVMLSHRAISSNLDALARAWEWTAADTVVHALPLFHAHGLVLATLGPLHIGGRSHHAGKFSTESIGTALAAGGTMLFAVPTMYHRLADAATIDAGLAGALGTSRLLVSGSAALSLADHQRVEALTGQGVVERYGLTESLMNCAVRSDGARRPGYVGPPLDSVELRLLDDDGVPLPGGGRGTMGEVAVRGPGLFTGYLNDPTATAAVMHDGWLATGDMAFQEADGYVRIVGRKSLDLIKTGGYRVGAGEVEDALCAHPGVAEAAVTGEADPDLGQRVIAWVVRSDTGAVSAGELVDFVARGLAAHKRPREVVFVEKLPRNPLGKVLKRELLAGRG
ncbi:MAG: acyl-CoA synthetase [Candidatus Dormibacteria bacterium]